MDKKLDLYDISSKTREILETRENFDEDKLIKSLKKNRNYLNDNIKLKDVEMLLRESFASQKVPTDNQLKIFNELQDDLKELYFSLNVVESTIRLYFQPKQFLTKKEIKKNVENFVNNRAIEHTVVPNLVEIVSLFIDIRNNIQHGALITGVTPFSTDEKLIEWREIIISIHSDLFGTNDALEISYIETLV